MSGKKRNKWYCSRRMISVLSEDEVKKKKMIKWFSRFLQQMFFKCLAFSVFFLMILDSNMHRFSFLHSIWRWLWSVFGRIEGTITCQCWSLIGFRYDRMLKFCCRNEAVGLLMLFGLWVLDNFEATLHTDEGWNLMPCTQFSHFMSNLFSKWIL